MNRLFHTNFSLKKIRFTYALISCFAWLLFNGLHAQPFSIIIGTSGPTSDGIYHTFFNPENGRFTTAKKMTEAKSPNFLAMHPTDNKLYSVCRWGKEAGVIGYDLLESNQLKEFSRMTCTDGMGCHISVHPSGQFLLTAQYGGGSVALFPLDSSGVLQEPIIYPHRGGSGVVKTRQNSPHPHWCGFSPCGRYALVPDLGLDQIIIYQIHETKIHMTEHSRANSVPGGGPRHMRFSQDGRWIYLLNELNLSISTFAWDSQTGTARQVFSVQTLTEEQKAAETFNSAAEILTHPNGKWLYTSNRGHDSVSFFNTLEKGQLKKIQTQPIRGAFPRNINLSPCGTWLLSAGQDSCTISAHRIDQETGKLTYQRGAIVSVPNPVCIVFSKD